MGTPEPFTHEVWSESVKSWCPAKIEERKPGPKWPDPPDKLLLLYRIPTEKEGTNWRRKELLSDDPGIKKLPSKKATAAAAGRRLLAGLQAFRIQTCLSPFNASAHWKLDLKRERHQCAVALSQIGKQVAVELLIFSSLRRSILLPLRL
eukprot:gnl/MRDRNA2_/MRDRNA2_15847_c0_seq1.p1 gnl/MRDRNA2_/MRDRNA2_15847_c0~~gnl/MRDRNA2_/MRDRNA2_15847_c0_seq1.p1  ORF type:complete len:149 (+),score=30.71 gnl/MRDRNA2_/MRDRNA2_15847_c0_seq1:91-537(+)